MRFKIAEGKDYTNYGVLGIVAIVAVVGLVLLFSERLELSKEAISSDNNEDVTGAFTLFSKQDCVSSSTRPCYDKQTGKKIVGLDVKGGEKVFTACMKNPGPAIRSEFSGKTAVCDEEKFQLCYDGRSKVFLRKFSGDCVQAVPTPVPIPVSNSCIEAPDLQYISSIKDAGIYALMRSSNGVLFAGGLTYYYNEVEGGVVAPKLFKSMDDGKTWTEIFVAYQDVYEKSSNFIMNLFEDSSGAIYATGTRIWKSTDGGNTFIPITFPGKSTTYSTNILENVRNIFIAQDGSLIVTVGAPFVDSLDGGIYKSTDGGKSWQKILSHTNWISSVVQTNDGSFVFADTYISNIGTAYSTNADIYKYQNGILSKTFSLLHYPDYQIALVKATDGTLVTVTYSPDNPTGAVIQSGETYLYGYKSTDNGVSWVKGGSLPNSYQQPRLLAASDGSVYAVAYPTCGGGDALYRTIDKGQTWSKVGDVTPDIDIENGRYIGGLWVTGYNEIQGKILIASVDRIYALP